MLFRRSLRTSAAALALLLPFATACGTAAWAESHGVRAVEKRVR
ncbi:MULTISPECIES: hypothetical protein [Streptomyces]|nr:hypothetical protein OG806_04785 [Streptomyces sp. NBC_00882]WSZ55821.1 hypothetical protein OH824_04360 [Streptomyces canus]